MGYRKIHDYFNIEKFSKDKLDGKEMRSILNPQKEKKTNQKQVRHQTIFENMFELMIEPMLRDKAFISMNPICLVFCKIAFA